MIVAIIIGSACLIFAGGVLIGRLRGYETGYEKGVELSDTRAEKAISDYIADQIWEYEDVSIPLRRVNKITSEVQKRYPIKSYNQSIFGSPHLSDWRTVTEKRGKK